ncbi:unnamed protein product [Caenorhabditis brenneri]
MKKAALEFDYESDVQVDAIARTDFKDSRVPFEIFEIGRSKGLTKELGVAILKTACRMIALSRRFLFLDMNFCHFISLSWPMTAGSEDGRDSCRG